MTNSTAEHLLSVKPQIESAVEGGGAEMREGVPLTRDKDTRSLHTPLYKALELL